MIEVRGKRISTLFSADQIAERNLAMAAEMQGRIHHDLLVIATLKGSFIFAADLIRAMHAQGIAPEVEFITLSSYGKGTESQGVQVLRDMLAEERGEVTADVASAKALTKTQLDKLSKTLSERVGKTVTINATVDESLIGGLVVKVGSKMIDSSIRSKLNSLQNAMKEVG